MIGNRGLMEGNGIVINKELEVWIEGEEGLGRTVIYMGIEGGIGVFICDI